MAVWPKSVLSSRIAVKSTGRSDLQRQVVLPARALPPYKAVKISHILNRQWIAIYGLGGLGNLACAVREKRFQCESDRH